MSFQEEMKRYVSESGLVNMKDLGNGMYLLKYKKKVFFKGLWDEYLEHCRGTIVDEEFNLITYPFQKIYNYGIEKQAPVLKEEELISAYRKINGFMVAVSFHNNDKMIVSTTGSIDSDYVKMAREFIDVEKWSNELKKYGNKTFLFECIHPNDPHIIKEKKGMYLLGFRENEWKSEIEAYRFDLEYLAKNLGCYVPENDFVNINTLKKMVKECNHEGFVCYIEDGRSFKIKSPYYLTLKWLARNPKTEKITNMKNDIKKIIDEEYYPLVDSIRKNIDVYTTMNEQERLNWIKDKLCLS